MKAIIKICLIILLSAISFWPASSQAQGITFTKIVDTDTPIPGGVGNFSGVCTTAGKSAGGGRPAIDAGNVVFHARGSGIFGGIYKSVGGVLSKVVDSSTEIPNSGGVTFSAVGGWPSIDGETVPFWGFGFSQEGIYTSTGGSITLVADRTTPIPGGSGNFGFFGNMASSPRHDDGNTVFYGNDAGNSTQEGVYNNIGGSLSVVADLNTPVPGGTGTFGPIGGGSAVFGGPNIHQGTIVFGGRGVGQVGIYKKVGTVLTKVVDTTTPIPGGTGNFAGFNRVDVNNEQVAFIAGGIYVEDNGSLRVVADRNTPIPGGSVNFVNFGGLSLDSGNVSFWGLNTQGTEQGIYTDAGGSLIKVIDLTDTLDGKAIGGFRTGDGSLSGNQIAFCAFFVDGSNGVFVADLPGGSPPVADAGPNQSIHAGELVTLDGSGSLDDLTATENLLYAWSFDSVPAGTSAMLIGAGTISPSFTSDLLGDYVVSLVVTDEEGLSSAPNTVTVSSLNVPPTADAGLDQGAIVGNLVTLDGSGSSDADFDVLTFTWTLTGTPPGSTASLTAADTVSPFFVPDLPGIYISQLVVNDSFADSAPDQVTISVVTAEVSAELNSMQAINIIASLPPSSFTKKGNQKSLSKRLSQVIKALQNGNTQKASKKLTQSIERTDGCALRGVPDSGGGPGPIPKKDYIADCASQEMVYPLLTDALTALAP